MRIRARSGDEILRTVSGDGGDLGCQHRTQPHVRLGDHHRLVVLPTAGVAPDGDQDRSDQDTDESGEPKCQCDRIARQLLSEDDGSDNDSAGG
jgi:hypothetical protein